MSLFNCQSADSIPLPYNVAVCRKTLYELLLTLLMSSFSWKPSPDQVLLKTFSLGVNDRNIEVCYQKIMLIDRCKRILCGVLLFKDRKLEHCLVMFIISSYILILITFVRLHCMHDMDVAYCCSCSSVICLLSLTAMSPAVMAEPVETLFGCGLVGPNEPCV